MTSRVEHHVDRDIMSSTTSLPLLKEGQSSLVAPAHNSQTITPRQKASQWALDIRESITHCIETNNEVPEDDILDLKQELIEVFILALQHKSRSGWVYLHEVLGLLEPFRTFFEQYEIRDELYHYLERILHHVEQNKEKLFDLQLVESLSKVFPEEIAKLKQTGAFPARNYCMTPPTLPVKSSSLPSTPKKAKQSPRTFRLPDGSNPYNTHVPHDDRQIIISKPLTLRDIQSSIADVGAELALRESIWSNKLDGGSFAKALQTDIPEEPKAEKASSSRKSTPRSSISSLPPQKIEKKTPRIEEAPVLKLTGREAVEYFAKLHHVGKIQSIYFNRVPNRHYRPYDLSSVHKNKAEPEHFVFSTFGVLHVYPDQPAESQSLSEWQREAVLWSAVSSIPFFKNFLIKKMFYRWRYNKLNLDYQRHTEAVSHNLLQAVPIFGAALLQVTRLLKELITVEFLPFDDDKTYMLTDFENCANFKNIQAEKILDRFFSYCKLVIDVTAEESFKKLKHCEDQVKKKTIFTKDSLHLQKLKAETREFNLRKAKSETGRLGNFVKLIDQLIVEHMFEICKSQVITFVDKVLHSKTDNARNGYFSASLVFIKQDTLGLSPSKEKFISTLTKTLKGIPTVLCVKAIPMDGSLTEQEEEVEVMSPTKSEPGLKSVAEINRSMGERRKSTAATRKQESRAQGEGERTNPQGSGDVTGDDADFPETESQASTARSISGEELMTMPEIYREDTVTKEEDDMGIATPRLVIQGEDRLVVHGEGFMGQYSPLSKASLVEKLEKDADYQKALKLEMNIINDAMEEIDAYCTMNQWLTDIYKFCQKWTSDSALEFRGVPAFAIEQRLMELRQWTDRVRNFDKNFTTENGLFYIDCMSIHEYLVPRLTEIVQEVLTFVSDEAKTLAKEFCDEMAIVLENLKRKDSTMAGFAVFAKNYSTYKKNGPQYQQRVAYIKSLFETAEEEKTDDEVQAVWEAYMLQLQDASEFVNTQTPLMTQKLEDKVQVLEKEALELAEAATTGKFLDPTQNPTKILIDMRRIRDRFYEVQAKMHEASKWRDAICGEPYDLEFLQEITVKMDVRQELWKYVEVSMHAIKDCKQILFKKMNIKKMLEKIIEWQAAAGQLKPYLPQGDQVLSYWFTTLREFKNDLPMLHKLANDALKERHWKAIFVGMNEPYDPEKNFTVSDLLAYDLNEHQQLIDQVYQSAIAEYDLELKISQISKFWEERVFKLAKHIPDSVITTKEQMDTALSMVEEEVPKKPSSPRRRTKLEKYRQERAAAIAGQPQGLHVEDDDFYVLIEVDELKYQLEDSRISIRAMMQSPYLGDMKVEVENWDDCLHQVEEITDLWYSCQKKWLYLLKVFEKPELYKKFHGLSIKFEQVHNKFKDWMRVVSNDSKVLTVVNRKRGEKGYRLLQGDNLRNLFLQLIQQQEEVLKFLNTLMENSRMEFPRLYFISNEELVELLGVSRNPQAIMPFVRKCFHWIQDLTFALPPGTSSLNTTLDFALNAHKLEVTTMQGMLGEEVPLFMRVQAQPQATKWLKSLENITKNTIAIVLQACVQARMEDSSRQPIHLLEELTKLSEPKSKAEEDLTQDIKHTFRHWLLRFPVQCVLVAESILWERNVNKCLERCMGEDLKQIRTNLSGKLDQYIELLRESYKFNGNIPQNTKDRLHILLCSLINQTMHQRDIMDAVIASEKFSEGNFDWMRVLRYHMDITQVLRAKTEAIDHLSSTPTTTQGTPQPNPPPLRKTTRTVRRSSLASKVRMEPTIEEPPKLIRTKTTVSNDYQFSLCGLTQLGNRFSYDYEYQGPTESLVMTPLTDRALLSLTQALKNFYCGTLIGPAGVGKSETVKELAKLCGHMIYTVNCNEDLTVSMMSQYMMGIVQSGCWTLFDDTDRLTKGLMSVTAQHLDYLRTALRTLQMSSENQYKIRGQPRFDKKMGLGDKIIRRNSLTTLHPMPNKEPQPALERQKTVPHGFNEKGLVTYFEDTWVSEKDRRRRHSIEREIEIKESELYKSNKPPPLFYEHVKFKGGRKSATPDYSKLLNEMIYVHQMLGNVMFNGKLIQASSNFGCFMTLSTESSQATVIPENFRQLMRPCALIVPDMLQILEMTLCCHGYKENKFWAKKLVYLLRQLKQQLPRKNQYQFGLKDIKLLMTVADSKLRDEHFLMDIQGPVSPQSSGSTPSTSSREMDNKSVEEHSIVYALKTIILQSLESEDDVSVFNSILRDLFPVSSKLPLDHEYDTQLVKAVKDQLKEDNLKETPEIMTKIMQLNSALNLRRGIIMVGPAGSGKTTCSQTLARSINRMNYLLFAPDHSKDELTTDRDLVFYAKHKLKGMENEPELQDDIFLAALDPKTKTDMSKGGKKMKKMSLMLGKLSEALNDLQASKTREFAEHPKVDVITLNPTATSPQEFLGEFSDGLWRGGLFPKILRDSNFLSEAVKSYIAGFKDKKAKGQDVPSVLLRWILLDGVMHPSWTESLNSLFDEEMKLSLANSGNISLADTTALLYETGYLGNASPATISRCTIINFGMETVKWTSLYESWTKNAKSKWILSARVMKVWGDLVSDIFGPTIKFLKTDCCTALLTDLGHMETSANEIAPGIQEVETFLKILTALLDRLYLREEFEKKQKSLEAEGLMSGTTSPNSGDPGRHTTSRLTSSSQIEQIFPNYDDNMKGMFAFAYIWAFGGHIHERYKEKFSKFAHDALYRATHPIRIPLSATVFDYCLDETSGIFIKWTDRSQERMKILPGGFTITPDVEKYTYLVELMLAAHQPVLVAGMPGVGKTSLLQTMVLPKQTHSNIMMSPGKNSKIFQEAMIGHILELKHKASNVLQGPGGVASPIKARQYHLFYIDDLNTAPANKAGGYQPPLELLRQIISQGGTYDRERKEFQSMDEAQFLAATTLPSVAGSGLGKSCHVMSSRLTRRFVNFTLFTPTAEGLMNMFGRNIQNWLEEFPTYSIEHHFELSRAMTIGLLELYQRIKEKFRPTPAFSHYTFSLHDVSRVVHGILLMSPRSRTRKMLRRKKHDTDSMNECETDTGASLSSTRVSRQTSWDSRSRTVSVNSSGNLIEVGQTAPMMKVIGQLWCHECTRAFFDRLVTDDDRNWYSRLLEEIVMRYFCMPREDPKSEMAAISEETHSQTGHITPPTVMSSQPITPIESDDEVEGELSKVDSKETDDGTITDRKSDTSVIAVETPDTRRMSVDTSTSNLLSTTRLDTETLPSARTRPTDTEGPSESEYESESQTETSDDETTETETDMETPRDLLASKRSDIEEDKDASHITGSSTKSTETSGDFTDLAAITKPRLTPQDSANTEGIGMKASTPSIKAGQRTSHGSHGSLKLKTVTFKAGLLADWEHEAYFGPLMNMDEIKGNFDCLTDFIFSKFYMTIHTETHGLQPEKGYVEGSEEALADALSTCLNVYNNGTSQKLELVFFSDAVRHAARLSRVLSIQGGHAVLLGMSYSTGRATLARLASYIAHCKLFEPKPQSDSRRNLEVVHEHIKRACYHTGVLGRPTVLLVHEGLGHNCLQDVACIMAEGTSPGLYSEEELSTIVSQMMPGGVQTKRVDKIEQAFERFLKKIRQNLHVIVLLNYKGNSFSSEAQNLYNVLSHYPGIIKNAVSIDTYRPWQYEAYVKVADVWLRDQRSKIPIPWHPTRMLDQIAMTAQAMAYIHMSSKRVIERQYCHQRAPLRFFSPLTFMEFVHLFRVISAYIVKKEYENIGKHEQALGKVNEAFGSISELKREVSDLMPQHKAAAEEIKALVEEVEAQKEQYIGALDKCKEQEEKIEGLQGPLEELRREAQTEFDKVNPNYNQALVALNSLNRQALEEVKSFRKPPEPVEFVMNAVCLLFNEQQDWEHAKLLMIRENFMDALIFYDKDNIPDDIYEKLREFTVHPDFQPEYIASISKATASICTWIHAVYSYAHIHRNMQPRLRNLLEQEEKFTQAQAKLGQLRVEANRIKSALESKITVHRAAVKRARTIEKHIQSIEKKIARSVNLMEHISMQHFLWKSELRKARHNVLTSPGDALITAACVLYHGPLSDRNRAELLQDWLDRAKQGNFVFFKSSGHDKYPLSASLDGLLDGNKEKDSTSEISSSHGESESTTSGIPCMPEVKTFKYLPCIYDTSKYYKSELRRQGSMECDNVPENDDSDDEDEQSPLMNRNGFLLQEILSDFDELSGWRLENLPTDLHSIQNALLMRVSSHNRKTCWPLLIDPDNQAELWVKALQTSRNVFSESDLREGEEPFSDDMPLESYKDSELPPSRGTALTFDTATEYTFRDEAGASTTTSYTTDVTKSGLGRHSRNTFNTEELRPVTSIAASWETYNNIQINPTLENRPEHNLWIIEADDPCIDSRLVNAVVHGVTVLITHLERKPLNPLFRGLLLKQFYVDKEGNRVIKVGGMEIQYHQKFCLYLSTSVPLFLKGDGLHEVPLHRMCIINMSLSDEAIINHLLLETMKVERKEFEGQKRSNENDIIMHRQRLVKEHEMIREKTLNLEGPLLEDQTMLKSLMECQVEVEKNRMILEETRFMGDHLEEKFAHYMPMIMQSAVMYTMIKKMSVLHTYYYMPFYKFIELYSGVIKSRDRGKGSSGAPQARAQELADATGITILRYISMMMFEQHFTLLQLLVAMERMRMNRKVTNKELSLFINGFDKMGLDEMMLMEHKPSWMENQSWIDCLVLEQLHHPFHGLRRSLISNSSQWQEYFQHPITLMNPVPGSTLQELSVFQKCILWKMCCPHRTYELATAMTLFELGNIRLVADHYNIREVYKYTDKTTPVVFVFPNSVHDKEAPEGTQGYSYVSPTHEVKRLAKEVGMEGKVKVMNFGVKGQIAEVTQAIEDCIQNGYWLLLQNYHLAEEPSPQFFQLLKDIVYRKWIEFDRMRQNTEMPDDGVSLVTFSKPGEDQMDLHIHNTFRLWITTLADSGRLIPGVLVQHGLKVTCEKTGNFKSTLQKAYRSVAFLLNSWKLPNNESMNKSSRIMPLALVHSLLLHQSYYGNNAFVKDNHWTLTDLAGSVEMFKKLLTRGQSAEGVKRLISQVYFDHCTDLTDTIYVWSLVSVLAELAAKDKLEEKDLSQEAHGVMGLLRQLLSAGDDNFNLRKAIDSIEELSAKTYGLPEVANSNMIANYSRIMAKDLMQVIGAPELLARLSAPVHSASAVLDLTISTVLAVLQKLPQLPDTNKNQVNPIEVFLHYETEGFKLLVQTIQSDLHLLQKRSKGEVLPGQQLEEILLALNAGNVPESWLHQTYPSCSKIMQWIKEIPMRMQRVVTYVNDLPAIYNICSFLRPDRFFEAVRQAYARKHFKDVNNISMEVQVMPSGMHPSVAPKDGIFINGLHLYNALWDATRGILIQSTADSKNDQEMPVIWLKPYDTTTTSTKRKYHLFRCPVFCSIDYKHHHNRNIVTELPLPSLEFPSRWHQQRVFLSLQTNNSSKC